MQNLLKYIYRTIGQVYSNKKERSKKLANMKNTKSLKNQAEIEAPKVPIEEQGQL